MSDKKDDMTDLEIFHSVGDSLRASLDDAPLVEGDEGSHPLSEGGVSSSSFSVESGFLRDLSYDFRTLLTSILGFSELMLQERFGAIVNERYRRYIDNIHVGGQYLLDLTNDIASLSASGVSGEGFSDRFSVFEEVSWVLGMLESDSVRFARLLRWDIPSSLFLEMDRRIFRRILFNILSPALRFGGRGGEIFISGRLSSAEDSDLGDYIMLRIRDTHLGLLKGREGSVLELPSGFNNESGSSFLSIRLAQALMESFGGRFEMIRLSGDGVLVTLSFPL